MTTKIKLTALILSGLLCSSIGLSANAKTLHSYEFPKDYTEEEGITDEFRLTNGFHACIEKGKLSAISTFGMPVTFVSPEFSVENAKYFVFSFKSQMAHDDSTLKVTIKTADEKKYDHEIKLTNTNTNLYAIALPENQQNVVGFEITPQVRADFSDMYGVELDFARFIDSQTLVSLKTGSSEIFDGKEMLETDSPVLIKDSRTLTTARCVAEALGANVEWDDSTKTVTISKDSTTAKLTIGSDKAYINDKETTLDVAAQIIDSRTYTPARFVAEALGYSVDWDDNSKTVIITDDKAQTILYTFEEALAELEKLQPKSALDNEILLTMSGVDATASEVKYATQACSAYYSPNAYPDELTLQTIDKETLEYFKLNSAVVNLANEADVKLSDEEFVSSIADQITYYKYAFGAEYDKLITEYTNLTPYSYFKSALYNIYYTKLVNELYGINGSASNKDEIIAKAKEKMDGEYVRAKHILIQFEQGPDGSISDESKQKAKEQITAVLESVNKGEDFDILIALCGQDPGMTTNPDGYYFTKGEMVKPFEESAFSLGIGQVSGIVETSYGYHIIKRLPIEADNAGFFASSVYQSIASEAAETMIYEKSASITPELAENFKQKQIDFIGELYGENN